KVFDQRVDGLDRIPPEAGDITQRGPLLELAFLAAHSAQGRQFLLLARIEFDPVVEGVCDFSHQARPVEGKPDGSVALFYSKQSIQEGYRIVIGAGTLIVPVSGSAAAFCNLIEETSDFAGSSYPVLRQADRAIALF